MNNIDIFVKKEVYEMETKLMKIWEKIKSDSINVESNMPSLYRKQTGSYYTGLELAYLMMKELVAEFDDKYCLLDKKFLEPCVGTGNFVFAYLRVCSELNFSKEEYKKIINNIFVCDINNVALDVYKKN